MRPIIAIYQATVTLLTRFPRIVATAAPLPLPRPRAYLALRRTGKPWSPGGTPAQGPYAEIQSVRSIDEQNNLKRDKKPKYGITLDINVVYGTI